MLLLGSLLPPEVWRNRDVFFHDGMRMEIGPCHRRYATADFYERGDASASPGQARLDAEGNLDGLHRGAALPARRDRPEGARRGPALGLERRAALPRRRATSAASASSTCRAGMGGIQTYEGSWFLLQTAHRADLAASDYTVPMHARSSEWVAGGIFDEPSSARHLAWRQIRPLDVGAALLAARRHLRLRADDAEGAARGVGLGRRPLHAPLPHRRATAAAAASRSAAATTRRAARSTRPPGESIQVTENLRRGFTGLALRPNAYDWRVQGEREVLAPINITRGGYPGRSRAQLRLRAGSRSATTAGTCATPSILQGALKERGREYDLLTLWIDYQTQQPLYLDDAAAHRSASSCSRSASCSRATAATCTRYPAWPGGAQGARLRPRRRGLLRHRRGRQRLAPRELRRRSARNPSCAAHVAGVPGSRALAAAGARRSGRGLPDFRSGPQSGPARWTRMRARSPATRRRRAGAASVARVAPGP